MKLNSNHTPTGVTSQHIMNAIKKIALLAGVALAAAPVGAQNTYSGYFLENYNYRHQMNPAFGNENGFVGFPVLGNLNIAMRGTLHTSSLLYNVGGKTVLFTNPGVSASEVMGNIHDKNRLGVDMKLNILNFGFKAFGGYNTVGINAVAGAHVSLPGSLFSLLKEGVSNKTYKIENLNGNANAYAEIALNHSRDISQVPGLRVGAAVKFIVGGGCIDARFKDANLRLGEDSWDIQSNAEIEASVKGLRYELDYNEDADRYYVNGAEFDSPGINGFGLGFDLGAEYKWNDFRFSAAILDLGFINWSETQLASTNGVKTFKTSDYTFEVNGDDDAWDQMQDDISALYQLEDMGNAGGRTSALHATLNFGVEYEFPLYRRLTFGLLNSTHFNGPFTWTQFRVSANVRPVDILSASANLEMGTYGVGFGWLLNLNLKKGFNLFVGMDHTLGKLAKNGSSLSVPLNSNASLNLGIDFPF